ncbi:MFS transporter [Streptomyces xiamenensis]|uniref:MFS transporter n=1 Tax=Streptomyces xiamenensis TaxID=408015 RepID=UPI0035E2DEC0
MTTTPPRGTTIAALTRRPIAPLLTLAFTARIAAAALPITLLLAIADRYGYARAGLLAGTHTITLALLVPLRGRLLDRYGHRNALPLMATAAATLTIAATASVTAHWPWWSTLLLAIGATISAPPLNAALRSAWRRLVTDHADLKAVHSADSVLEEAGFVAAPLAAGTAIAVLGPVPAYCASAAVYLTVLAIYLAAARRHQLIPATAPTPPTTHSARTHQWLGPLAQPRILLIMLPLLIMGCIFGGASIYIPAYSQHHGLHALIGPLLAALSAGGVIGGILYALLPTQRLPLWTTYRLLTVGFALPAALLVFAQPAWLLATLLASAGLFVTPLFITAFLLVDATATDSVRIEANTWVGASTDISNGILATVIGALAAQNNFDTALTVLSGCAAAGLLTAALLPWHGGRPQAADSAAAQPTVAAER